MKPRIDLYDTVDNQPAFVGATPEKDGQLHEAQQNIAQYLDHLASDPRSHIINGYHGFGSWAQGLHYLRLTKPAIVHQEKRAIMRQINKNRATPKQRTLAEQARLLQHDGDPTAIWESINKQMGRDFREFNYLSARDRFDNNGSMSELSIMALVNRIPDYSYRMYLALPQHDESQSTKDNYDLVLVDSKRDETTNIQVKQHWLTLVDGDTAFKPVMHRYSNDMAHVAMQEDVLDSGVTLGTLTQLLGQELTGQPLDADSINTLDKLSHRVAYTLEEQISLNRHHASTNVE